VSTKVYNAYRVKRSSELWVVLRDIDRTATANVVAAINGVYDDISARYDRNKDPLKREIEKKGPDYPEVGARERLAQRLIRRLYRIQSSRMDRCGINFDASVTVRQNRGRFYLIWYADCLSPVARCFDFMDDDPRLEDFHYQNQTDRPDGISASAWAHRRKVWAEIYQAGWDHFLTLVICDFDRYRTLDPWYHRALARSGAREARKRGDPADIRGS
jgi:hypothetical protein